MKARRSDQAASTAIASPAEPEMLRRLIGRRIRRRRLFLNKTQAALAEALGVPYQQLQKYENGQQKVPEDRLDDIADLLGVSPAYFSAEPSSAGQAADALERFIESPQGIDLNRAIAGLDDGVRARFILAVIACCDDRAGPDDAQAAALASWLRQIADKRGTAKLAREVEEAINATKVELAKLLGKTLRTRKMTQLFAAQILRSDQARISTLARGDIRGVSMEKLLRFLVLLGWDIGFDIAGRPADRQGRVEMIVRAP